jgi:hypothetical protein
VLGGLIFLGMIGGIVIVQIYRYRRVSSPAQRQQTRWVVYGVSMGVGGHLMLFTIALFFPLLFQTSSLGNLIKLAAAYGLLLLTPLSLSLAILRSRLWDIDLIINRTLVYGTLTAILALVYVGLVIALQFLSRGLTGRASGNPLVVASSTLVIAALFNPLRKRLQKLIDREQKIISRRTGTGDHTPRFPIPMFGQGQRDITWSGRIRAHSPDVVGSNSRDAAQVIGKLTRGRTLNDPPLPAIPVLNQGLFAETRCGIVSYCPYIGGRDGCH